MARRLVLLAVLAGCGGGPDLAPCAVRCDHVGGCPAGTVCAIDGFCRAPGQDQACTVGPDGGVGPDATSGDGAPDASCIPMGCGCADPAAACAVGASGVLGCALPDLRCGPTVSCPAGYDCVDNACACADDAMCGVLCGTAGGTCGCGTECRDSLQRCRPPPPCLLPEHCPAGFCGWGACQPAGPGQAGAACDDPRDCVQGVCYQSTCVDRCVGNAGCGAVMGMGLACELVRADLSPEYVPVCVAASACAPACTGAGQVCAFGMCVTGCSATADCSMSQDCTIVDFPFPRVRVSPRLADLFSRGWTRRRV